MRAPKPALQAPFERMTLDQIRALVTVADEGSFTAGARRLGRVQSAVSQSMASLEGAVGFKVWDRTERRAILTERGRALVVAARRVLAEVERLREVTTAPSAESLAMCVDALFPSRALVSLATSLLATFPGTALRLDTDTLGAVTARVARRECDVGIAGPLGAAGELERVAVGSVLMIPVAAKTHALAARTGRIPTEVARAETQIVLSEHGPGGSPDQAVLSSRPWRVADLQTKADFIRGGLGWGNLPEHLVQDEVKRGDLVRLRLTAWNDEEHRLPLALVFPPALRRRRILSWLVATVPELCTSWGLGPQA
jgi:DNA-binding transcriptional LysR family regulator